MKPDQPFRPEGPLTSREVPSLWRQTRHWQTDGVPERIDLADVGPSDSSGLALLLEWTAWARAQGTSIELLNPPPALLTIAGLSQAESVLGWESAS